MAQSSQKNKPKITNAERQAKWRKKQKSQRNTNTFVKNFFFISGHTKNTQTTKSFSLNAACGKPNMGNRQTRESEIEHSILEIEKQRDSLVKRQTNNQSQADRMKQQAIQHKRVNNKAQCLACLRRYNQMMVQMFRCLMSSTH